MGGYSDDTILKNIDEIIDGGDGISAGDFRWGENPSPWIFNGYLKGTAINNPN